MNERHDSSDLPDRVDDALAALWAGSSDAMDRLVGGDADDPGELPGILRVSDATVWSLTPPKAIGSFEILGELGRGGMGIVYRARQRDPDRLVALKVIRSADVIDQHRVRLFQREVQTLARLRHPHIAALYEAGRTEDGQHFFVMELIEGVPLTDLAQQVTDGQAPGWSSLPLLLAVFCRVCAAISYAHQKGVIHRDLKPSNILVTPETQSDSGSDLHKRAPDVKVLDFGLARVTDADVATVTGAVDTTRVKGTLPYMSPEQLLGDANEVDVRSDVYSLGVVLYQMLTGRLPFDPKKRSIAETMRAIREDTPARPGNINRILRGDLETIILKAIEREPSRRYQSAAAFAEDIVRFLGNQPILARPPSAAYQARKLIARHKVGFAATVALLGVSVSAAAVSTVSLVNARAAERTANEQRLVAESVNAFLVNMLSHIDPRKAKNRDTTLLRELLEDAARRVETELGDQPRVAATLDMVIGQVYLSLGSYDKAEVHLVRSLDTHRDAFGPEHPDTLKALHNVGTLRVDTSRYDEAVELHTTALEGRLRVLGEDHPDTLASMDALGNLYREQHRLEEAETLLERVVEQRRDVLGDKHPDTLVSLNNLGNVYMFQNKSTRAERALRESLAGQQETLREDHLDVLVSKNDLATVLGRLGERDEAVSLLREVVEGFRRQLGEGHLDTLIARYNLVGQLRSQVSPAEAVEITAELAATAEAHLPERHYLVGVLHSTHARRLFENEQLAEAAPLAVRGFEELEAAVGPSHIYTRQAADTVADVFEALDRPERAAPYRELLKGN